MDLTLTPEEPVLREEVRAFVQAKLPDSIRHKGVNSLRLSREDHVLWQRTLHERGWGGRGCAGALGVRCCNKPISRVQALQHHTADKLMHLEQSVQLHGGRGMTDELTVSHWFKRLLVIDLSFGDTDPHPQRFAALSQHDALQAA